MLRIKMSQRNHLRTSIINSYLNQIEENNQHIQSFTQLMINQEQTLSRLIFENQNNTSVNFSSVPLFYNTTLSDNIRQSRNTTNNSLHQLNNQLLNIFRFPRRRNNNSGPLPNIDNILDSFFDPIEVVPNTQQIENGTRVVQYREIENPQNTTCPISLVQFQPDSEIMEILYCHHYFMKNELENWFTHNSRCPLCRYDIRNYNPRQRNNN